VIKIVPPIIGRTINKAKLTDEEEEGHLDCNP
jgi:hypothetical protein